MWHSLIRPGALWGRPSALRRLVSLLALAALGLALARLPLSQAVLLLAGAAGALALLLRPAWALYGLALAIPFGSLREFSMGGLTVGASEILLLAMLAAWALRLLARRQMPRIGGRLRWAILLFLSTILVSFLPAGNLASALVELARWGEFLLLYLFVAAEVSEGQRRGLLAALLLAGIAEGALGAYQFLRQVGPEGFVLLGRYMRAYGTFAQPNPYGGYLGLTLPLAYGALLAAWPELRAARGRSRRAQAALLALSAVGAAAMLAGLLMSWSRGALLGLAGGLALAGLAWARRAWPALLGLAVALAIAWPLVAPLLPADVTGRLAGMGEYVGQDLAAIEITDENFSTIERLAHWAAAWRMFDAHPWLGVGSGQYATIYPQVALSRWRDPLGHAHNYYLHILAQGGLVGLGAYLLMMGSAVAAAWRAAARNTGWRQGLALGGLGMLGHLLAHSLVDNLYVHEMTLLVALILGLAAGSLSTKAIIYPASRHEAALSFSRHGEPFEVT
jgi:putative inorganic carbon (HCO3(-)) transporter